MSSLRWRPNGGNAIAPSLLAFDEGEHLVAQVVRYDEPAGWKAYVRGHPVGGHWDALESAQKVAEHAVRSRSNPSRRAAITRRQP